MEAIEIKLPADERGMGGLGERSGARYKSWTRGIKYSSEGDRLELHRAQDGGLLGELEALIAVPRAAPGGSRCRVFQCVTSTPVPYELFPIQLRPTGQSLLPALCYLLSASHGLAFLSLSVAFSLLDSFPGEDSLIPLNTVLDT